jgi:hypothetical protein
MKQDPSIQTPPHEPVIANKGVGKKSTLALVAGVVILAALGAGALLVTKKFAKEDSINLLGGNTSQPQNPATLLGEDPTLGSGDLVIPTPGNLKPNPYVNPNVAQPQDGLLFEESDPLQPKTNTEPAAPVLAIPNSGADGVPRKFGFVDEPKADLLTETPMPAPNLPALGEGNLTEVEAPVFGGVDPVAPTKPEEVKPEPAPTEQPKEETAFNGNEVTPVDPRNVGLTTNDGPEQEFEETSLTVQRTLTAVTGDNKQIIRLRIPVMYESRIMRLEGPTLTEAQRIQGELKKKSQELTKLKTEMETLLRDWNSLVEKTTPQDVLLPESPTLPHNQSANSLNREEDPTMAPGKAISFEVLDKSKP